MSERVECRSEHTYAQYPQAVWWNNQRLAVTAVETEARIPTGRRFRVKTAPGTTFELEYDETRDAWYIREL